MKQMFGFCFCRQFQDVPVQDQYMETANIGALVLMNVFVILVIVLQSTCTILREVLMCMYIA